MHQGVQPDQPPTRSRTTALFVVFAPVVLERLVACLRLGPWPLPERRGTDGVAAIRFVESAFLPIDA